jgi:hypothetical protein
MKAGQQRNYLIDLVLLPEPRGLCLRNVPVRGQTSQRDDLAEHTYLKGALLIRHIDLEDAQTLIAGIKETPDKLYPKRLRFSCRWIIVMTREP